MNKKIKEKENYLKQKENELNKERQKLENEKMSLINQNKKNEIRLNQLLNDAFKNIKKTEEEKNFRYLLFRLCYKRFYYTRTNFKSR